MLFLAGGLRHPAVLAATIGLHLGLFLVIAPGLGPQIRKVVEDNEPVYVPLPEPEPVNHHVPGDPLPYVAASLRTRRDRLTVLIDSCYPAAARRDNEEGKALAHVVIGAQGLVLSWRVEESSGFRRLDTAMDCVVRRLAFEPACQDGTAVASEVRLPIVFRLN